MSRFGAVVLGLVVGCGGTPQAPPPTIVSSSQGAETPEAVVEQPDPRILDHNATFADLVDSARRLDERGGGQSSEPCLLRVRPNNLVLLADVATAIRPVPTAPVSLQSAPGPFRNFSRWGQRGAGQPVLISFTSSPPPTNGPSVAIILTDRGLDIRTTTGEISGHVDSVSELEQALGPAMALHPAEVLITAEAGVPMSDVVQVLGALPLAARHKVVFAVAIEQNTALPSPPPRGEGDTGLCTATEPIVFEQEGNLSAADAQRGFAGFADVARECLRHASPESARGGRVEVDVTVGPEGTVVQACAHRDEIGDSGIRTCLLDNLRRLHFARTGGHNVLRVPLVLTPDRSDAQTALCE